MAGSTNRYFLNEKFSEGDPLMTKNPTLKDMLAGPIISGSDPSLGESGAVIAIVVFADFTCEYCYRQEEAIRRILDKYENHVRFVWKDYPEPDEHSLSYQAALAARCAFLQDKFWPYHDRLFERAGNFSENDLFDLARESGLDLKEFDNCRSGELARQLIADNIEEAHALDITGVPFIYVNDLEFMGEITFDELERIIKFERER